MFLAYWKHRFVVALLIGAWTGGLLTGGAIWRGDKEVRFEPPSRTTTPAEARSQQLIEAHGCWRQQAPADMRGKLPGHVVVTTRVGRTVYGGRRLVGHALDQQFAHQPAGLTVWAFCR